MGAPIGPQRKEVSFFGSVGVAYTTVIDLAAADFRSIGIAIMNFDAATRLFVSFDNGVTDNVILDPARNRGVVLRDIHPSANNIQIRAAAGTVEANVFVWA